MDREGVEGGAALGHDQQPDRSAPRRKSLLDRATAGDELLVFAQQRLTIDGRDTCRPSVKLWSAQDRAPIARLPGRLSPPPGKGAARVGGRVSHVA